MSRNPPTLFGFPVVASEQVTVGTALLVRLPTFEEVVRHGSYGKAVEALAEECGIKVTVEGINDSTQ